MGGRVGNGNGGQDRVGVGWGIEVEFRRRNGELAKHEGVGARSMRVATMETF